MSRGVEKENSDMACCPSVTWVCCQVCWLRSLCCSLEWVDRSAQGLGGSRATVDPEGYNHPKLYTWVRSAYMCNL